METICYREHFIEIVRHPKDGFTTLAYAQAHQEHLRRIRIGSRVIEQSQGQYYVVADILGVSGDVIRSIRPASAREIAKESVSGRINAYLWARHNDFRARQEKELAELRTWLDTRREKLKEVPHQSITEWRNGKTLLDQLEDVDQSHGLTIRLNTHRDVKRILEVYFPERIPLR